MGRLSFTLKAWIHVAEVSTCKLYLILGAYLPAWKTDRPLPPREL